MLAVSRLLASDDCQLGTEGGLVVGLVKIGAKIVRHGRSITFQMAEVMVSRGLFQHIINAIAALRALPPVRC